MARPPKRGIEYFSLDCDYAGDEKMEFITALFDLDGEAVIIKIWCQIYKEHGYYMHWDNDKAIIFTKKLASRCCNLDKVKLVVDEAITRGIFDKAKYKEYGILTSKRIQKQYLSATKERTEIELIEEYLLLEKEELNSNVAFKNIFPPKNPVNPPRNSKNPHDNTQSKVKKSKVKKSKENIGSGEPEMYVDNPDLNLALCAFSEYRTKIKKPLTDYGMQLIISKLNTYTSDVKTQIKIINQSIERGWQGVFPLANGDRHQETDIEMKVQEIQRLEAEWNGQRSD